MFGGGGRYKEKRGVGREEEEGVVFFVGEVVRIREFGGKMSAVTRTILYLLAWRCPCYYCITFYCVQWILPHGSAPNEIVNQGKAGQHICTQHQEDQHGGDG